MLCNLVFGKMKKQDEELLSGFVNMFLYFGAVYFTRQKTNNDWFM